MVIVTGKRTARARPWLSLRRPGAATPRGQVTIARAPGGLGLLLGLTGLRVAVAGRSRAR